MSIRSKVDQFICFKMQVFIWNEAGQFKDIGFGIPKCVYVRTYIRKLFSLRSFGFNLVTFPAPMRFTWQVCVSLSMILHGRVHSLPHYGLCLKVGLNSLPPHLHKANIELFHCSSYIVAVGLILSSITEHWSFFIGITPLKLYVCSSIPKSNRGGSPFYHWRMGWL